MRISAAIITLNEERNIARAMESVRCCDEVVVVDSGSTDRTVEIASALGARVLHNPWSGFAAQKNFAAEQASHEWIFSIDADEALSEGLEAEIWSLKKDGPRFDAYSMPRMAQYLGRWIRHSGWYPDRKVRLYRRGCGEWVGDYVHESVRVAGRVGQLQSNLLHFTCATLSEHLRTMDRYTSLAARQMVSRGRRASLPRMLADPPWVFVKTYFVRRGFLDGAQGFALASMASVYQFVKLAKTRKDLGGCS
jgi:glycosyltransferase involved in cell wall biosynthesis